jgi:predicted nucleotidyltransferase
MPAMERGMPSPTWRDLRSVIRARFERDVVEEGARGAALQRAVLPGVEAAIAAARAEGACARAWLIGSYTWGVPAERSDVDLVVEGCGDPFRLAGRVSAACGRDVHVIDLETAPPTLRERAVRDGRPL